MDQRPRGLEHTCPPARTCRACRNLKQQKWREKHRKRKARREAGFQELPPPALWTGQPSTLVGLSLRRIVLEHGPFLIGQLRYLVSKSRCVHCGGGLEIDYDPQCPAIQCLMCGRHVVNVPWRLL